MTVAVLIKSDALRLSLSLEGVHAPANPRFLRSRRFPAFSRRCGAFGDISEFLGRCDNGPESSRCLRFMNLPNSITMSRIIMIPLFLWILSPHFLWQADGAQEITAAVLFVLASITDGLDGYLARRRGQITTMGMLLDPLADKIMVTAAFIELVAYNPEVVKVWIAVVIIGREFLISGLRSIAASEGFTITASELGKLKTVVQIVAVVSTLLTHRWAEWHIGYLVIPVKWYAIAAVYFTVLVSSISAIDYFVGFWKKIDHASKDRRKTAVLSRGRSASIG